MTENRHTVYKERNTAQNEKVNIVIASSQTFYILFSVFVIHISQYKNLLFIGTNIIAWLQ